MKKALASIALLATLGLAVSGCSQGNKSATQPSNSSSASSSNASGSPASSTTSDTCVKTGLSLFWKPGDPLEQKVCAAPGAEIEVKISPEAEGMKWQTATSTKPAVASVTGNPASDGSTMLAIKAVAAGETVITVVQDPKSKVGKPFTVNVTVKG